MSRNLRYLRILWTVFCGIVCVLLIVLWVRSYWWHDILQLGDGRAVASCLGTVHACVVSVGPGLEPRWILTGSQLLKPATQKYSCLGIGFSPGKFWPGVVIPDWLPTLLFATLAAAPWIRWSKRFSIRTLLIATTLIAVVLGVIVWAVRR
jgi:hypothetical protein